MEQLRMFIAEGAEVVLEESEIVTFNEIPTFEEGRITTFGSISESKLKFTGKAVKLSNNH
ncbi:hypothetical protein J1907_11055 [Lysinibacillus sphaericus]|uniref:hypothetical protein n=1 Tax=Lysinibacillus sphaericus TaxID=1421 RepID=UPI001A9EA474|nr:hypothetical protein [Lysinibacillus sphaericus]QTB24521.1 hypothetical protein J1907_11055 [Lysinibacillus sphaericus]